MRPSSASNSSFALIDLFIRVSLQIHRDVSGKELASPMCRSKFSATCRRGADCYSLKYVLLVESREQGGTRRQYLRPKGSPRKGVKSEAHAVSTGVETDSSKWLERSSANVNSLSVSSRVNRTKYDEIRWFTTRWRSSTGP